VAIENGWRVSDNLTDLQGRCGTVTTIATHYATGGPVQKVRAALEELAPGGGPLTFDQVAGFDDFHTAGRMATMRTAELLAPAADDLVLDAGSGLGGPARHLAQTFGCRVIGIDLTPDFVAIANLLNDRLGMADRVEFRVGDITDLDMPDASVDHAWTQHVAMNIAARDRLYAEIRRVLRPGGRFAIFDVIDGGGGGELLLPVPWATEPEHSHLVTRDEQRSLLERAGFRVDVWEDPTEEMVAVLRAMLAGPPPGASPSPLSPNLFIDDLATKGERYFANMESGRTALILAVCTAV
jgi:sarcosine/dimethylglycine N-methyltransferase